jgi:hypothetical protein
VPIPICKKKSFAVLPVTQHNSFSAASLHFVAAKGIVGSGYISVLS